MRITNDNYSPIELLAELVARRGATAADTSRFFERERAKHDWLVDTLESRIDTLLESFKRYGHDVNATQWIRDDGVDLLLCVPDHGGKPWRLGLQVKSELEAKRERKKGPQDESMISVLKRQAFEAESRTDEWWVLPCFDLTLHFKLQQAISSEIVGRRGAHPRKLVDARACRSLLAMSDGEVDALCTLFLCRDDEILWAARSEVVDLHPVVSSFVIKHLVDGFAGENLPREDLGRALEDAAQEWVEHQEKRQADARNSDAEAFDEDEEGEEHQKDDEHEPINLLNDLSDLLADLEHTGFISYEDHNDRYRLVPAEFPGLCALYFEARVRHGLSYEAAAAYVLWLTRIR